MKTLLKYIHIFLFAGLTLVSCSSDEDTLEVGQDSYLDLSGVDDQTWTYFSLSNGTVVGTSAFGSANGDEEWKKRTDWDMAICGKYVRTNSGTSGNGQGGLMKVEGVSYEAITTSVSGTFEVDTKK